MTKYLIFFLLFLPLWSYSQKDAPAWISSEEPSKYPSSLYLTGVGSAFSESEFDNDAYHKALEIAKANLSKKLLQTIKSTTIVNYSEVNYVVTDELYENVESSVQLVIAGIDIEQKFYDKKNNQQYVFVCAEKKKVKSYYENLYSQINEELKSEYESALYYFDRENRVSALKHVYLCQLKLNKRALIKTYLSCLGVRINNKENYISSSDIQNIYNQLNDIEIANLDDLVYDMQLNFGNQLGRNVKGITINNPVLKELKVSTPLSKKLQKKMSFAFAKELNWDITEYEEWKKVKEINEELMDKFRYNMHSDYNIIGKEVLIRADVFDLLKEENVATYRKQIPLHVLQESNLDFTVNDYERKLSEKKSFISNELNPSSLSLSVRTNFGNESFVIREGEKLFVSFMVNTPSYIRIIYHMADGTRALILENFHINSDQVGEFIKHQHSFVCSPPFGLEYMQVIASTEKFKPLSVKTIPPGYKILTDPLNEILSQTRKISKGELKAESRIIIHTITR